MDSKLEFQRADPFLETFDIQNKKVFKTYLLLYFYLSALATEKYKRIIKEYETYLTKSTNTALLRSSYLNLSKCTSLNYFF